MFVVRAISNAVPVSPSCQGIGASFVRRQNWLVCTAILDGGPATGKADLIDRLLTLLAQAGHVPHADVPALQNAVLRREQLGSTGIGRSLVISHARPRGATPACDTELPVQLGEGPHCGGEFDGLDWSTLVLVGLVGAAESVWPAGKS